MKNGIEKPDFFLVKMCENKRFANNFRSGKLYANRLSHFRNLESAKRGDPSEGVVSLPVEGAIFTMTDRSGGPPLVMTEKDFSGPPLAKYDCNIFCMHMAHCEEYKILPSGLKLHLEIADACIQEFGEHAIIITHPGKFFDRVDKRMTGLKCRTWKRSPVKYQTPDEHPFDLMHTIEAAFYKDPKFSYQREYRLAFDISAGNNEAICLDIGDLSDISLTAKITKGN